MLDAKDTNTQTKLIYIALANEGVDVWRPVQAINIENDVYKIMSVSGDDAGEEWEFALGDVVRVRPKVLNDESILVAFELAKI